MDQLFGYLAGLKLTDDQAREIVGMQAIPHLMAQARTHVRQRGKSDPIDALAVARSALAQGLENLPTARLAGPVAFRAIRRETMSVEFIGYVGALNFVLVVPPQDQAHDFSAFLTELRAHPGEPYASAGIGSPMHLGVEMMGRLTETQVQHKVEELQQFSDRISACRITLERAHRHHRQGPDSGSRRHPRGEGRDRP